MFDVSCKCELNAPDSLPIYSGLYTSIKALITQVIIKTVIISII